MLFFRPFFLSVKAAGRARGGRRVLAALGVVLSVLVLGLVAWAAHAWSVSHALARLDDQAVRQLDLYASLLDHELGRQDHLPGLLDIDGDMEALLAQPGQAERRLEANRRLSRFTVLAGMVATEIVDTQGRVVAASDWYEHHTRLGQHIIDAPCVPEALDGGEARRFVADPDGSPEVCLGRQIQRGERRLGAVLVRMSLAPTEAAWVDAALRDGSERPFVADDRGRIFLAAVADWKGQRLQDIVKTEVMMSHGVRLARFGGGPGDKSTLYLVHDRPLVRYGWRLHVATDTTAVWSSARTAAWGGMAAALVVALMVIVVWQRRRVLAQKLAAREALERANDQLEHKVRQRTLELERSNAELRRTQEDLLQASKLALLGQLSAGISHELGQPLTALRGLADNAQVLLQRQRLPEVAGNLSGISDMVVRMGRITSQLKAFVRKSPSQAGPVAVDQVLARARQLVDARLQAEAVVLHQALLPGERVVCDGHRLEQVLVNLLVNALDALRPAETLPGPTGQAGAGFAEGSATPAATSTASRAITVSTRREGPRLLLRVADTGPGLSPEVRQRLFEPFFTTKAAGAGMGLGLVISAHIVHEFGGQLRAVDVAQGAAFEFDLPLAQGMDRD